MKSEGIVWLTDMHRGSVDARHMIGVGHGIFPEPNHSNVVAALGNTYVYTYLWFTEDDFDRVEQD